MQPTQVIPLEHLVQMIKKPPPLGPTEYILHKPLYQDQET